MNEGYLPNLHFFLTPRIWFRSCANVSRFKSMISCSPFSGTFPSRCGKITTYAYIFTVCQYLHQSSLVVFFLRGVLFRPSAQSTRVHLS